MVAVPSVLDTLCGSASSKLNLTETSRSTSKKKKITNKGPKKTSSQGNLIIDKICLI